MSKLPIIGWLFRPNPYLITPRNEEEEKYGVAVLITPGEAAMVSRSLRRTCPKVGADLIEKYEALKNA